MSFIIKPFKGEFRMKHHHKGLGSQVDKALQDEEKAVKIVIAASKTASEKARSRLFNRYLRSFLKGAHSAGDKEDAELTKGLMTRLIVVTTIRSKMHHVHKLAEEGLLTPVQVKQPINTHKQPIYTSKRPITHL